MEISKEDLDSFRREIGAGFQAFREEVKAGFSELKIGLAETNSRLEQTNARLDHTNARLEQTNARLDQTNARLDQAILMVRDFRKDICVRLDGIGDYLRGMDGNLMRHEERIRSLEQRVDNLEQTG